MLEQNPTSDYSDSIEKLDAQTGGMLTAATSSVRSEKLQAWLETKPDAAILQVVYKELSRRDKGVAKTLRGVLDAIRHEKNQERLTQEWSAKAHDILAFEKFPIATAMAWQQDAAKAGAPLSKAPLASLKNELAERIQSIEDIHTSIQVQREASVLLAQRIDLLSTKSWQHASDAQAKLQEDITHWHSQAQNLQQNPNWNALETRYVSQLEAAIQQLTQVHGAFTDALNQAQLAATDSSQALPPVPVWADEINTQRAPNVTSEAAPKNDTAQLSKAQHQQQVDVQQRISSSIENLTKELEHGHSKSGIAAAQQLRQLLKQHAPYIDETLEQQAQTILNQAQELKDWQRWRADQIRQELVQKAQALLHPVENTGDTEDISKEPAADQAKDTTQTETSASSQSGVLPSSPHSPRKLQELLRHLRNQWKQTDQGGTPNHALWKQFDQACNTAYRIVAHWLTDRKQQVAAQKNIRLDLLAELEVWGATFAQQAEHRPDWKAAIRTLSGFSRRWREAGHVSEKIFAELQPKWKAAFAQASAPLNTVQKESVVLRKQWIAQASAMAEQPLDVGAIKALQQSWQQEAQRVPLERRQEQKLWEAFNKPINQAFQRKTQQRQETKEALQQHDKVVLAAAEALQEASQSEDARAIRAAMDSLQQAMQAPQSTSLEAVDTTEASPVKAAENTADATAQKQEITEEIETTETQAAEETTPQKPAQAAKPIVAMRGDDRQKQSEPTQGATRKSMRNAGTRGDSRRATKDASTRPPKLSNTAFRAQRQAFDDAQAALRKLAAQAHGESVTQLIQAWQQRQPDIFPAANVLGKSVSNATHSQWLTAISQAAQKANNMFDNALLRLEIAAEVPTPAEHLDVRRALQLQLLTQRNDPSPQQTWQQDIATVLTVGFDNAAAQRLQKALKVLMKK